METTTTDYEKLFKLFQGTDELRPDMLTPFRNSGVYYATDFHSLIYMYETDLDTQLDFPQQDTPKIRKHLAYETTCNIELSIAEIESNMPIEMVEEGVSTGENIKCDECDAEGEVIAEYDGKTRNYEIEVDCPVCRGSGYSEERRWRKTGKMIPDPIKIYTLLEVGFTYKQLGRLITASKMLNQQTIIKTSGTRNTPNVFKVGNATIIVAPTLICEHEESDFHKIEVSA